MKTVAVYPLRLCVIGALLLAGVLVGAGQQSAAQTKPIFDATYFEDKPGVPTASSRGALSVFPGMQPIQIAYAHTTIWPGYNFDAGVTKDKVPPEAHLRQVARRLDQRAPEGAPIVLDIEHLPVVKKNFGYGGTSTQEAARRNRRKLIRIIDIMRDEVPGRTWGFYGLPPVRSYWAAVEPRTSARYRSWVRANAGLKELARHVDVLFPSLYTFYDLSQPGAMERWETYARRNIEQARRLAGGKPVYPFLMPYYHRGNEKVARQPIPGRFWQRELELAMEKADGLVIWYYGDRNGSFTPEWGWWQATRAVLRKR